MQSATCHVMHMAHSNSLWQIPLTLLSSGSTLYRSSLSKYSTTSTLLPFRSSAMRSRACI